MLSTRFSQSPAKALTIEINVQTTTRIRAIRDEDDLATFVSENALFFPGLRGCSRGTT